MAVEVLADELMLYRFGGKLVNGTYHLKLNPDEFAVHRPQAVENARRILEENRLAPQPSSNEEKLRELVKAARLFTVDGGVGCGTDQVEALEAALLPFEAGVR